MVKKIVVGVDGSDSAAQAARKAAELAGPLGAELVVVSAYAKFELETLQAGGDEFRFTTKDDSQTVAAQTVATLKGEFPEVNFRAHAKEGKPAVALVQAAEDLGADLIVVGNKRVQGLARVLGSIARDIAAHATCDVYVAHTHQR